MPESTNNSAAAENDLLRSDGKWFAVYTATHHEKQVQKQLTGRDFESFLPVYMHLCKWKKRTPVALEMPLFPNYVFVRIADGQKAAVLGTPGVFSIIGAGKELWEIPELEIEALRSASRTRTMEPHPYLAIGERARVRSGVLAGLEGVIVRRKSNLQIVLNLDRIMRSVAVEVCANELEPVSRPSTMPN